MQSFPWQRILDWYEQYGRHDFPWRQYHIAERISYRVWLAEILLQQTQADRVIAFYNKILEQFPSIEGLGKCDYEIFFPYYQGLGYYSRARNLLKTAQIISTEYQGIFPKDKQKLKLLPGVGEYTARAILAFGFGETLLAWDTNLDTLFARYYHGSKVVKLNEAEKNEIEQDFRDFISEKIQKQPMEVRGEGTIGAMMRSGQKKSEVNIEGVGLPTDAFDTFGNKSIEKSIGTQKNLVRNINNALMDWARLMEPKNSSLLDPETYIFTESKFYITRGSHEVIEKKISISFPIPDAQVVVVLHQDHKIYYSDIASSHDPIIGEKGVSELDGIYSPFILPPSESRDTRKYVQDYFRTRYHLELSVRPVHHKWLSQDGKPYIIMNAQIQAGDPRTFREYDKKDMKSAIERLYSL